MAILGDYTNANKFYIINSSGNYEWVPSLRLAEKYTKDPKYKEWYNKDIYATSEDFVVVEGKTYLKSEYNNLVKEKEQKLNKEYVINTFKQQTEEYINRILLDYANSFGYDNIYTMISWKDSSIKKYKEEAKAAISYRDKIYQYHFDCIDSLNVDDTDLDLTAEYLKYQENFPKG